MSLQKLLLVVAIYFLPFSQLFAQNPEVIVVTGEASMSVIPDRAQLQMTFRHVDKKVAKAQQKVNTQVNHIVDTMLALAIDKSDIQSSAIRVFPKHKYTNNKQVFEGMQVERNISITVHNLDKLSNIIDEAVSINIAFFSPPQFFSSTQQQQEIIVLQKAMKNARNKAQALADAEQITLGKAVYIQSSNGNNVVRPVAFLEQRTQRVAHDSAATEILTGSIDLKARVTVHFAIHQ